MLLVCVTVTLNRIEIKHLSWKPLTTVPHSWQDRMTSVISCPSSLLLPDRLALSSVTHLLGSTLVFIKWLGRTKTEYSLFYLLCLRLPTSMSPYQSFFKTGPSSFSIQLIFYPPFISKCESDDLFSHGQSCLATLTVTLEYFDTVQYNNFAQDLHPCIWLSH